MIKRLITLRLSRIGILHDDKDTRSNKINAIVLSLWSNNLEFEGVKQFLIDMSDKNTQHNSINVER